MNDTAHRPGLVWAVMAMEAAFAYPLLSSWLSGPHQRVPLGPLAAVGMLFLGYAAYHYAQLPGSATERLGYGFVCSLGLRLLVTPLPEGEFSPEAALMWIGSALVPAAAAVALWWRGGWLAETELTADGVRSEFTLVGGGLLILLALYGHVVSPDLWARLVPVALFLTGGLLALGLSRQEAAGSPNTAASGSLVACCVAGLFAACLGLLALLTPEVVSVFWALMERIVLLLVWLLLLPFVLLFSWLRMELPLPEGRQAGPNAADAAQLAQQLTLPEWVQQILVFVIVILSVAVAGLLFWLLLALLMRASQPPRPGVRPPVAVESLSERGWDADRLLASIRRWLLLLAGGALLAVPVISSERAASDPRSAYRIFLRWASRQGFKRAPAETPREFERRLAAGIPQGLEHYRLLTEAYELARYGSQTSSEQEMLGLRRCLSELLTQRAPSG